jgi:hypothetical protein
MRQTRIGRRSDERDHLMLQILLLTEKEITAMLSIDRKMASEMGLSREANSPEMRKLSEETSIEEVAKSIKTTIAGQSDLDDLEEGSLLG